MATQKDNFKRSNKWFAKASIAVIIVLLYFGTVWYHKRGEQVDVVQNPDTNVPVNPGDSSQGTGQYRNGTFFAAGNYLSPGGLEEVDVNLVLADDIITSAEVVAKATSPTSKFFQDDFVAHYQPFVAGKSIADLHLTKISGSSLTPQGFNDALEKIKTQAQL